MKYKVQNNPYTSPEFETAWMRYHGISQKPHSFNCIEGLKFIKYKGLPLYQNIGKSFTNGITYQLKSNSLPQNRTTFLILDVPEYFDLGQNDDDSKYVIKIRQYKGYLADFRGYLSLNAYMEAFLKPKTRSNIRKELRKMDKAFDIDFRALTGKEFVQKHFESVFADFRELLIKRYSKKNINNHFLDKKKWSYLKDVFRKTLASNKAIFFALYEQQNLVALSSNFRSKHIVFGFLPVFDTKYSKFNPGTYLNYRIYEWCIKNEVHIYDQSKGDYDYKKRFCNLEYDFYYHIVSNSKSLVSRSLSLSLQCFFSLKQYLREKNIHEQYHRIIFKLKNTTIKKRSSSSFK